MSEDLDGRIIELAKEVDRQSHIASASRQSFVLRQPDVRMGRKRQLLAAVAVSTLVMVIAAVLLLGTRESDDTDMATSGIPSTSAPRGDDSPILLRWDDIANWGGDDALIVGTLAYDGATRCYLLESSSATFGIVWPSRAMIGADGLSVVLADGTEVPIGAEVSGGGGYHTHPSAPLLDGQQPADLPEECYGPSGELAVFNPTESPMVVHSDNGGS